MRPLSWSQERLWFLDQLDRAAGAAYNIASGFRLDGTLDRKGLQAALDRVLFRHEGLRARFSDQGGRPVQTFAGPGKGFALAYHDLSLLEPPLRLAESRRVQAEEAQERFDLASGPLIRGRLLRLGPQEHILLLTQHHIVSDGWSVGVLVTEIKRLYDAFSRGQPDPLPALPVQYGDYASWQREGMQGPALQSELEYWRSHLRQLPARLTLPTDRPRPAVQSYAGAELRFTLLPALLGALRRTAREHGVTLFMVLMAGWAALLSRLSGQDDVVVGTPVASRHRIELEALIGLFVNTLTLRMRFPENQTVGQLLEQVRATSVAAYAHQDVPFERVVEAVAPERSLGHNPLFQAMLVLNHMQPHEEPAAGLKLEQIELESVTAVVDISISFVESDDQLKGSIRYASDLFNRCTVQRIADNLIVLLDAMATDSSASVSRLPLMDEKQRRQVLEEFNATKTPHTNEMLVHALFEQQVRRRPQATAVVADRLHASYEALNCHANRIAHWLLQQGVRPDDRVAICAERSVEMLAAVLGVLKSGGAYVPLDPSYPQERLAYMLQDSEPAALLTQSALRARLSSGLPTLMLDSTLEHLPQHDPRPLGLLPSHLAYVIYTSGSTGQPKGVMVEHRQVVNLWSALASMAIGQCTDPLRISLNAALSFDASVQSVVQLLSGHTVVVVPEQVRADAAAMLQFLRSERIDVLDCTPAQLELLLAQGEGLPVQKLLVGGEAIRPSTWSHLASIPDCLSFNVYGPTECTVDSTLTIISAATGGPHIGRPLANTRLYVLDVHRQPVPVGVAGELYIAGAQVGRGYLNQSKLTAERFIVDPFVEGERMYKTGDLGRWLPDGNIEYLGRNDFQVKVRGFRVELGEIEARLSECVGVQQAAVIACADAVGGQRLVAYVVRRLGHELKATELRTHLAVRLPSHMVPAAFIELEGFPLNANGKLDRQKLPTGHERIAEGNEREAPEGPLETGIAQIWQELLGVAEVGRHDDFFTLGGHSLLAVRLISRLRDSLRVEVTLRDLFGHSRLAPFADLCRRTALIMAPPSPGGADWIEPTKRLSLSLAQRRLWFLTQLDTAAASAYHLVTALRLFGALDVGALERSLSRIVQRHDTLRSRFVCVDGEPQLEIDDPVPVKLAEHDLRSLSPRQREEALEDSIYAYGRRPFDLAAAPPLRLELFRAADDENILLLTQHHIAADGWSMGVLVRELSQLYGAFVEGKPDPLPPLQARYADFAQWQRQRLQGTRLASQLEFWRRHLSGAPALLGLPLDRPRPARQSHRGASVPVHLPASLAAGLRQLGSRHGATLFMTLLAGWALLLSRLSGQDDVVVGTAIANRERVEFEPLIGFFVNTLALRISLSEDDSGSKLIAQVRQTALDAYAHQDLPFDQVVEAVQPQRSTAHNPLFQALLMLDNTPGGTLTLPGLALKPMPLRQQKTTQFDVGLILCEDGAELTGQLVYATDLFNPATARRMADGWCALLEAMVADDSMRVHRLPLMTEAQRRQVLEAFNATDMVYPREMLLHEMFERQVRNQPHAVALRSNGSEISYAQLNRDANRIAHWLLQQGVRPDDRVAICTERNAAMVAAVLGVLKAGGAYVPVDPRYPAARRALMLADSAPVAVLTQTWLRELQDFAAPALMLDADLQGLPQHDPAVPGLRPSHLAYVIYTSGSTGTPKGVMIEHRNAVNFISWALQAYSAELLSDTLFSTSINFDLAVFEMFAPLAAGARVTLVQDALDVQPSLDVSLLNMVPSAIATLLDAGTVPASVRSVNLAGEPLPATLVSRLFELGHIDSVANLYGPTETTTYSTWVRMERQGGFVSHIGRPLANTQVYVLDRHGEPVPIGVTGEIYIGGDGIARGYLGRPELSRERFLDNPFSRNPAARMYRTGDLGRWRSDGTIEYRGRNDFQVKIRGFRVELGEIESRLSQCAGVQQAVVVARADPAGAQRLVAYVVARPGRTLQAAELRSYLGAHLPAHMMPAAFVELDKLPLTPNGKLDRQKLPDDEERLTEGGAREEPRGALEEGIAAIWRELLGVANVGREDDFFTLGGHSLLAVRLMSRLRQRLDTDVDLVDVVSAPSLRALAEVIAGRRSQSSGLECSDSDEAHQRLVVVREARSRMSPSLVCLPGAGSAASSFVGLARHVRRHDGVHAFEYDGLAYANVNGLARHCATSLISSNARSAIHLLGHSFGGWVAFETARQLHQQGVDVAAVVLLDTNAPTTRRVDAVGRLDLFWGWIQLHAVDCDAMRGMQASDFAAIPAPSRSSTVFAMCGQSESWPFSSPADMEAAFERYARQASLDYWPNGPLDVPVHLFVPRGVGPDRQSAVWRRDALHRGWSPHVSNLQLHDCDGGHLSMLDEPYVASLAGHVSALTGSDSLGDPGSF